MKRNQSGVSLISLVITIIVVIILAAVAFSSSGDTIENATFTQFTTAMDNVKTAFATAATTVQGNESANRNVVTEAQVYNFVAKGADTLDRDADSGERAAAWLPRGIASTIACTHINELGEKTLGIELDEITVNTDKGTNIPVSYFVTNTGTIFVWPPYTYQDNFYVTDEIRLLKTDGTPYLVSDATDSAAVYSATGSFDIGGVKVTMATADTTKETSAISVDADTATVFYTDGPGAVSPVGIETVNYLDTTTP